MSDHECSLQYLSWSCSIPIIIWFMQQTRTYPWSHTIRKGRKSLVILQLMSRHWEIQLWYTAQLNLPLLSCLCEWIGLPSTKSMIGRGKILLSQWLDGCSLTRFFPILCRDEANPLLQTLSDIENQKMSLVAFFFLHKMALQLIHHSVSLQSPVFTFSTSNNDFRRKGQFSFLIVHVYLQESNRKGYQFGVTEELVQVHISKNKTFLWTQFYLERNECMPLALIF